MSKAHKLVEVFDAFLKLGMISFGGPVAHLSYFREEFVRRRRWLDDGAYGDDELENAAEADGVVGISAFAVATQDAELHQHFRGFRGVAIAEVDYVAVPIFQTLLPVLCR